MEAVKAISIIIGVLLLFVLVCGVIALAPTGMLMWAIPTFTGVTSSSALFFILWSTLSVFVAVVWIIVIALMFIFDC